ncbi:MAG: heme-copper oxidase subunit III [Scytonema sp. PMC 1069.18]|nr:heme-copper oxidase subunit III [Scytonema sp. PMC 1069.18]MEC4884083.1 heme-copper oxidase subunit III [Scytonema sp. PMC 1070.18]
METFIPSRKKQSSSQGGNGKKFDNEKGKTLFGFIVFLFSETMIFASLIVAYVGLRLFSDEWLPPGVKGPEITSSVLIHSVVLISSSLVIYLAERSLKRHKLNRFRLLWVTTSAMGAYFLSGEVQEWLSLDFGLSTGAVGGTFYFLTGFHGLHVFVGILLQTIMLIRSFIPNNYNEGHYGVTAVSYFWHLVDTVWVVLFSLLYLW